MFRSLGEKSGRGAKGFVALKSSPQSSFFNGVRHAGFSFADVRLERSLENFFVAVVMISIGLRVSGGELLDILRNRALFTSTLLANCVLIPAIGFLLIRLLHHGCRKGVEPATLSQSRDEDARRTVTALSVSTRMESLFWHFSSPAPRSTTDSPKMFVLGGA